MSNDHNLTNTIPSSAQTEENSQTGARKPWHQPVISRIEIAQTLAGVGPAGDSDNAPLSV